MSKEETNQKILLGLEARKSRESKEVSNANIMVDDEFKRVDIYFIVDYNITTSK